jgi:putative glycosyltransferase (TIGR04372 family)
MIKKIIKFFFYIISPLIIFAVILLSPFKIIRFNFVPAHRIGEITGRLSMYLYQKKNNRYLDFFILTDKVCNKYLVNFFKKKVIILNNIIFYPVYKIIFYFSNKFNFLKIFILNTDVHDRSFEIEKSKSFDLPKKDVKDGEKFLKKFSIKSTDKIVCLIVRDSEYLTKNFPKHDYSYHNYRDCNIENYVDTINYLIKKKYFVFRMGVEYKKKIKIKSNYYIDYGNLYRNDFLDIFLAYRCQFVITSVTGWDIVPSYLFHKPTLWTNLVPYEACLPYLSNSIFLPKHYIRYKKKVSPAELSKILSVRDGRLFKKNKFSFLENSSSEIKEATKEIISIINGNKLMKFYQDIFWNFFNKNFNKNDIIYNSRLKPKSFFSSNFLKKNMHIFKSSQ